MCTLIIAENRKLQINLFYCKWDYFLIVSSGKRVCIVLIKITSADLDISSMRGIKVRKG